MNRKSDSNMEYMPRSKRNPLIITIIFFVVGYILAFFSLILLVYNKYFVKRLRSISTSKVLESLRDSAFGTHELAEVNVSNMCVFEFLILGRFCIFKKQSIVVNGQIS